MITENKDYVALATDLHKGKWNDQTKPHIINRLIDHGLSKYDAENTYDSARLYHRISHLLNNSTRSSDPDNPPDETNSWHEIPQFEINRISKHYNITPNEVIADLEYMAMFPIKIVDTKDEPTPKSYNNAKRKMRIHNVFTREYAPKLSPIAVKLYNYLWNAVSGETLSVLRYKDAILEANTEPHIKVKAGVKIKSFKLMSDTKFYRAIQELKTAELIRVERTPGASRYVIIDIS